MGKSLAKYSLQTLEKIQLTRDVYLKTKSVKDAAIASGASIPQARKWLADLRTRPNWSNERVDDEAYNHWKNLVQSMVGKKYSKLEISKMLAELLNDYGYQYTQAATRGWLQLFNRPPQIAYDILTSLNNAPRRNREPKLDLYEQGLPDEAIAENLNCTVTTVTNWRRRHRLPENVNKRRLDFDKRKILHSQGLTDEQIADRLNKTVRAIRLWRIRRGLKPNATAEFLQKQKEAIRLYQETPFGIKKIARLVEAQYRTVRGWIDDAKLRQKGSKSHSFKMVIDREKILNFIRKRHSVAMLDLIKEFKLKVSSAYRIVNELMQDNKIKKIRTRANSCRYVLNEGQV